MRKYVVRLWHFPAKTRDLPHDELEKLFPYGVPSDLHDCRYIEKWYRGEWRFTRYDFDAKRFRYRWEAEEAIRDAQEGGESGYYEILETEV